MPDTCLSLLETPADSIYSYHKYDKKDPEKITKNKYRLIIWPVNVIYSEFVAGFCDCYSFHKSFICKYIVK